jgi:hypothetical protein
MAFDLFVGLTHQPDRRKATRQTRRPGRSTRPEVEYLEDRRVPTVTFTIDPTQNLQPISRYIYGVNQSLSGAYSNDTLTRMGGNRLTAYNWVNNASNAGSDFNFQNDNFLGGGNTPGGAVIPTIQDASAHNAAALLTIPINGFVAADENGGGDVRNSGPNYLQTRFRQEMPQKGAPFTLTPDPNNPVVYQDEFVNWVKTEFPYVLTDPNRPVFFDLDNEPDLWSSTHAEVHPAATTYAELVQKTIAYATAIKAVMPGTQVFGPVSYGWQGFVNLQNAPDANGRDFLSFFLQQMQQADTAAGHRLVDVMDLHWYPEATGGGVRITGQDTTPAVVAARLQAPRSLWDPTYTETSWITQFSTQGPIDLLPRLQSKINANDPGMKLSISEYNYGGGADISGGIAEADVLGIFGRSGVFAASEWPLASPEPFIGGAFQMYRNFDGHNGTFGNTSVSAQTSDTTNSSVYASIDSANPNVMTLVALNKSSQSVTSVFQLNHVAAGATVDIYQLTAGSSTPQFVGRVTVTDPNNFTYTMPGMSVTTLRVVSNAAAQSFTYNWNGGTSSDWFTAANWTDANDSTHHAVPTAADTVVIAAGTNNPTVTATATVAGLQFNSGTLTLNANLKDTGNFTQGGGTIGFGASNVFLIVQGDVTRTGGSFSFTSPVGTLALSGQPSRHISDTSGTELPNLRITNDNVMGIVVNAGSQLSVANLTVSAASTLTLQGNATLAVNGSFTDNGKLVLNQPTAGNPAPVTITGTLTLAGTTVFDLTVGATAGTSYNFVQYASLTDNAGATFIIHGNGAFSTTVNRSPTSLSVALSGVDTFTWTGGTSSDWFTAANWTDAGGLHAVPSATDTAIIHGAPFDPVLSANATVANLRVSIGFLTIDATLTDLGGYSQDSGFVGFGADADQLIIDGNVNYIGGWLTMNGHGTIVLAGTSAQTVTARASRALPNLLISNTSAAGVTLAAGSTLSAATLTVVAGSALNLSVPAPGNATAPLVVSGTVSLKAGSHLNLAMGAPASGVTYLFLQFGTLVDNGVVFGFLGQGTFTPTAHENANSLTVTLA